MGFLDMLLGGEKDVEQKQQSLLTPEQRDLFNNMLLQVAIHGGVEAYPGTRIPEQGPLISQFLEEAEKYGTGEIYTAGAGALKRALTGNPLFGGAEPQATRDYWNEAFVRPTMSMFKRDILPGIRESNVSRGTFNSSGRLRAETNAAGDLMTNLSGKLAELLWAEQDVGRREEVNALNRAMGAVPLAMNYEALPLDVRLNAGNVERQLAQEPLEEAYQKWTYSQPYNNPWWNMAMPLVNARTFQPYLEVSQPWYGVLGERGLNVAEAFAGGVMGGAGRGSTQTGGGIQMGSSGGGSYGGYGSGGNWGLDQDARRGFFY